MRGFKDKSFDAKWEIFELITSAYFGKQYYFLESDGRVYSRYKHKYMSFADAVVEFCLFLSSEDEGVDNN